MLAGCSQSADRAGRAAADAQAAMTRGDAYSARVLMLRAVGAKDDVPDYWFALGQIQMAIGAYPDAYYAFSRAIELDRGNVEALRSISQLALMSGQLDDAEDYASQLETLTPGDPSAATTRGFVALQRRRPEAAITAADQVLAQLPHNEGAVVLKARALESLGKMTESAAMLEQQMVASVADRPVTLQSLLKLYAHAGDAAGTLRTRQRLLALTPKDPIAQFDYAGALYEAGAVAQAHRLTLALLEAHRLPTRTDDILSLWLRYGDRAESLAEVRRLAPKALPSEQVAFARFLLSAGVPAEAEALVAGRATLPVRAGQADAVAVLGEARRDRGHRAAAERLWDAVLAFDSSNVLALRGRSDLYLASGRGQQALADARTLVAENPAAPTDRLRLARCYHTLGNRSQAEAAYWDGFQEIPANPLLRDRLKAYLALVGKGATTAAVDQQYAEQVRLRNVRS